MAHPGNAPLTLLRRLVSRISRSRLDDELREEMESHVELRRAALIHEGMDPRAADAEARRTFGNATVLRERAREMWGFPAIESILQDVRYGARMLRRSPMFTFIAVVSIAGGLTAGTGIFALMNAMMYRPLAAGDGHNLYRVYTANSDASPYGSSSYADFEAFHAATNVIESACAVERVRANLGVAGAMELRQGEMVNPGCFAALKLSPHVGRFFTDDSGTASAGPPPIVIGHSLWSRRFARDSSIVGRPIQLNGMFVVVVAVAPVGFAGTSFDGGAEFWAPVDIAPVVFPPGVLQNRRNRIFSVYARLRDGVTREQAEAALAGVASQLRRLDDDAWTTKSGATRRVTVMRESDARFVGAPVGATIGIVAGAMAAVGVIVLIACVNLATMLLSRGASRAREISIRLAIGASRGRILRQLATESAMIAAAGAAVAIATVAVGVRVFEAYRPAEIPAFDLAIDWRVMTFSFVLALVASMLFGLAPALHTLRLALTDGLKGRVFAARARWIRLGAREALIVLQVSVSIALLLVSTLFVRAISAGPALSPGFNGANVTVIQAHLDAIEDTAVWGVRERMLQAAENVPNAGLVSAAGMVPMSGSSTEFGVAVDGGPERGYLGNVISPGYFATLEIPIRVGRDFDRRDGAGGALSAIVSETFAQTVWKTTQVLGRTVVIDDRVWEIVGVVADTRYRTLSEPFRPLIYLPLGQWSRPRFLIHAQVRDARTLTALEAAIRAVDGRVAIEAAMPFRRHMDRAMTPERTARWVGAIVGVVQLALAMMALWGLVAYAIERRSAEMGVRLALGATPSSLVRLMMRPATVLIVIGVPIGCAIGAAIATVMQSASVGLPPLKFIVVLPVAALFTIIAMLAAWWPARRAGLQDPAGSLRRE